MTFRILALSLLFAGIAKPAFAPAMTPVPEPGLLGLAALGVVCAILLVRR